MSRAKMQTGHRVVTMDDDDSVPEGYRSVTAEDDDLVSALVYRDPDRLCPLTRVALSFDDGPDPTWTPRILDILKEKHVSGAFFHDRRGGAEQHRLDASAVYREGNEIGNHTFTHPDISGISTASVDLELNLTERLFAAELGVQRRSTSGRPYLDRPGAGYQRPGSSRGPHPAPRLCDRRQQDRYDDWDERPSRARRRSIDSVFQQMEDMKTRSWDARLHHPAARRWRRSPGDHRRAALN